MVNRQLFEDIIEFPDPDVQGKYFQLVGLDEVKTRLLKESRLLLNPNQLDEWSKKQHNTILPLVKGFKNRAPLFIFAGDVGTGKTSLAESFGDAVSREENIDITLYRLSLSARGSGAVGEMTRLVSNAFQEISDAAKEGVSRDGKPTSAVILVIDEADALVQSRELDQMHHEDRAGVNAVIRGIDSLVAANLPVIVVLCSNRLEALDPAVRRRAAALFEFHRPNELQRKKLFTDLLSGVSLSESEIEELVQASGPQGNISYGYTYSDIVQRLLPSLLIDAFPDEPITFQKTIETIKAIKPTPPFKGTTE